MEIGRALAIGEDAARQRLNRTLGRLASALQRKGISSTATALAVGLGAEVAHAAPAGLAASVTSAVQSQMAVLGAAKTTTLFFTMTTSKITM